MIIMLINLFVYYTIQPLSFIYLFFCLKKQRDLIYINNFLTKVSLIPFLTLTWYILWSYTCKVLCVPFHELIKINAGDIDKYGFSLILMIYAWIISASYFILYFFNKKNKLGIYIYKLLFIMFVFVLFETGYDYLKIGK